MLLLKKVLFDFLVSLSSSFRYKNCNKQKARKRDGGVKPVGQTGVLEIGEGEGGYEGENSHPAHCQSAPAKLENIGFNLTKLCNNYPLVRFLM